MQEAIKARASGRAKKAEFKDPYVKPKMSKEDYLAAKAGATSGPPAKPGAAAVDLSPLLQSQQQMQQQIQQLTEQVRQLNNNSGGGRDVVGSSTTLSNTSSTSNSNPHLTEQQLDAFKREIQQSQRQANSDLLSQIEAILGRDALPSNNAKASSSVVSNNNHNQARLEHEISQLKAQVANLEDENNTLRQKAAAPASPSKTATTWRASNSSSSAASPTRAANNSAASPTRRAPALAKAKTSPTDSSSSKELQVKETSSAYELTLDLPSGVGISDLEISYGSGALQLQVRGGPSHSFAVAADSIDTGGIAATLQPTTGQLEISVPKK